MHGLRAVVVLGLLHGPAWAAAQSSPIPSPEEHFGHRIGAERKLVGWSGIVDYLRISTSLWEDEP